jgi:hypothetical protein
MNKIDVHICRFGDYDKKLYEQCLKSIEPASHLINIHFVDDISPLKKARCVGYGTGSAEYICHVDHDDYVFPEAFHACLEEMEKDKTLSGVYTNSFIVNPYKNIRRQFYSETTEWTREYHIQTPIPVHQLCIMRRSVFDKVKDEYLERGLEFRTEQYLFALMAREGDFKFLGKKYGYAWRDFKTGHHVKTNSPKDKQHLTEFKRQVLGPSKN